MVPGPVGEAPLVAAVRGTEVLAAPVRLAASRRRAGEDDFLKFESLAALASIGGVDDATRVSRSSLTPAVPRFRKTAAAKLKKIAARRAPAVFLASLRYR